MALSSGYSDPHRVVRLPHARVRLFLRMRSADQHVQALVTQDGFLINAKNRNGQFTSWIAIAMALSE